MKTKCKNVNLIEDYYHAVLPEGEGPPSQQNNDELGPVGGAGTKCGQFSTPAMNFHGHNNNLSIAHHRLSVPWRHTRGPGLA
jgi:hypothetical protein